MPFLHCKTPYLATALSPVPCPLTRLKDGPQPEETPRRGLRRIHRGESHAQWFVLAPAADRKQQGVPGSRCTQGWARPAARVLSLLFWRQQEQGDKKQQISESQPCLQLCLLTMVGPFKTHICAIHAQLFYSTEIQTSHVPCGMEL